MASFGGQESLELHVRHSLLCFTRSVKRDRGVEPTVFIHLLKEALDVLLFQWNSYVIPNRLWTFGVKENQVFDVSISLAAEVLGVALNSGDVVSKVCPAKDLIHHHLYVVTDLVV